MTLLYRLKHVYLKYIFQKKKYVKIKINNSKGGFYQWIVVFHLNIYNKYVN